MSSWRLWLLWLVLLLWDAPPTVTGVNVFKEPKGEELSVRCSSDKEVNVTRRIFCKNDCEEGDILVQTSGSPQTNGRFSIEHEMEDSPPKDLIYVTVSNLTLSDSGRYRCKWDRPVGSSYVDFMIEVTDAPPGGFPVTARPSGAPPEQEPTGRPGADAESKHEVSLAAGEDLSYTFLFCNPGENKTFCRNSCSEDILVAAMGDKGQNGRYRIQYKKNADDLIEVTVTIRNVSSADSGAYQVHLDQRSRQVWINVSSAPPGGFPVTAFPPEAPPEQEPTGRPGEASLAAGEDFSHSFFFSNPGKNKTFCRNGCSEDILIATTEDEGQNGRYRIQYKKHTDDLSEVTVTIRNVSSADSGLYKCHLDQRSRDVWIRVSPAPPGGTAVPSEAPPEQEPSGCSGGAPNTRTLILVLIPVCVAVLVTVITLTTGCMRRRRTDQGPGAGGTKDPQREYGNVYQNLCLEDMKAQPNASELHKI